MAEPRLAGSGEMGTELVPCCLPQGLLYRTRTHRTLKEKGTLPRWVRGGDWGACLSWIAEEMEGVPEASP